MKKSTISLSLALLVTTVILSATASSSFCAPGDNLCLQLTHGGKTWSEAMINAINAVLNEATAAKPIVASIGPKLSPNLKPVTKKSIVQDCNEAYKTITDNLKQCIGFVKYDPFKSLKFYLSAIGFDDCTDGLSEFGVKLPEATQFRDEIQKLTSELLSIADKKPGGATPNE